MTAVLKRLLIVASLIAVAACSDTERVDATGKGTVRGVNAVVDAPNLFFRIEERNLGEVSYGGASGTQRYDDLDYRFNFDASVPGEASQRRIASIDTKITRDTDHLFVLTGTFANPDILLWTWDERTWDPEETVFELSFGHVNRTLGSVDVYFDPAGTAPAAGNAVGTLSFGEHLDPVEFAGGDYVLTLTAVGDPQAVLYQSGDITYDGATTDTMLLMDLDPSRLGTLTVRRITSTGGSDELADPSVAPRVRVLHAAPGTGNVDLAENGDFAGLVTADLAFGAQTGDIEVTAGTNNYTFTDAGNQGAVLAESEETIAVAVYENLVLVGEPGSLEIVNTLSSRRPFATSPRIGFFNTVPSRETLDFYLLPSGELVEDNNPSTVTSYRFDSGFAPITAQAYDVYVVENVAISETESEKVILGGPLAIDLAAGDVVQLIALPTADPAVVEIRAIDLAP